MKFLRQSKGPAMAARQKEDGIDGQKDGWGRWVHGCMDRWMGGWTDGWTDG